MQIEDSIQSNIAYLTSTTTDEEQAFIPSFTGLLRKATRSQADIASPARATHEENSRAFDRLPDNERYQLVSFAEMAAMAYDYGTDRGVTRILHHFSSDPHLLNEVEQVLTSQFPSLQRDDKYLKSGKTFDKTEFTSAEFSCASTGLRCVLFAREIGDSGARQLCVAFRGAAGMQSLKAVAANILSPVNPRQTPHSMYQLAAGIVGALAPVAKSADQSLVLTGHSLGASLAMYATGQHTAEVERTVVFQPFLPLGTHRKCLAHSPQAQAKITEVLISEDRVTPRNRAWTFADTQKIKLDPDAQMGWTVHCNFEAHLKSQARA